MAQSIFERVEKKYLLTREQYKQLMELAQAYITPDQYSSYTICNLYYDTDQYDLIRTSIEKPLYKEKLRLRSYGKVSPDSPVFLELKKKFDGVVYKRRAILTYQDAGAVIEGRPVYDPNPANRQILHEIAYFLEQYPVSEKVYICYDRTAFSGREDDGLRITFDDNIRFRQSELRLDNGTWGTEILGPGELLMEIKIPGVFPLWLSNALSDLAIFPKSFSKYGACYQKFIHPSEFHHQNRSVGTSA